MVEGRTTFSAGLFFFDLCERRRSASACARVQALCAAQRLPITACLAAIPRTR
jgi:hypothetical protein